MPESPPSEKQVSDEYANERDMEAFWATIRPRREPSQQRWFLPLVLLLIVISIPWLCKSGEIGSIISGLPVWIWVALICSSLISVVTAVMSLYFWKDDDENS